MSSDKELEPLISQGLYTIVSDVIGQEYIVKLRRRKWDITNVLTNCYPYSYPYKRIMSGSKAEGFEMRTSDYDEILVLHDVEVIPSYRPLPEVSPSQECVLIYETDYTSPGFAVMKLGCVDQLNNEEFNNTHISDSLVWNSLGPYVCSKMFREYMLRFVPLTEIHGPCISGKTSSYEFDYAICLQCPYWPREASSFITRTLRSGWPSKEVVTDICNDGCLFVPISSKALHCQDALEMEWRMSFNLAEKKLIYSMNHCQFLCYGLLKLFLNEVLKKIEDIDDLLCSYFMKTAVFWEISEDKTGWTSQNFLCKFRKTFRRLLSWVHFGYCPNFFNPDNNMFAGKVCGQKQRLLIQRLRSFYSDGVLCLLKCSSLNQKLKMLFETMIFSRQPNNAALHVDLYVPYYYIEYKKIECILTFNSGCKLPKALGRMSSIRNIRPTSILMKNVLEYVENKLLQMIGETNLAELASLNYRSICNKAWKKHFHAALNIVSTSGTTCCESEIIVAKSYYMLRLFHNAIDMLDNIKLLLHSSQFMYSWRINEADYRRLRRSDTSCLFFMKSSIVHYVKIKEETAISELIPEIQVGKNDSRKLKLCIPPLVFANFLLVLCYHHIGDTICRNDVVRDLTALVWYDRGYHIHRIHRAISWEILGICQQLCGDNNGAHRSYIKALKDKYNTFKKATVKRIASVRNTRSD